MLRLERFSKWVVFGIVHEKINKFSLDSENNKEDFCQSLLVIRKRNYKMTPVEPEVRHRVLGKKRITSHFHSQRTFQLKWASPRSLTGFLNKI